VQNTGKLSKTGPASKGRVGLSAGNRIWNMEKREVNYKEYSTLRWRKSHFQKKRKKLRFLMCAIF